ncbi:AsmA family protein [Magnetospirillum sulfuroxidans]|uniref:AsmA family protein n=1 Tax=Magnetospirillum sulfuroxidans TaxID=611300 RepID=A0ABS5IET2_9PROT|nr:AsmA family protein [Magnetospirillum sulfuroxidans]MBR9972925.1 AsmA family protein [Magnetospirillum sulfuroxidans]
MRLSFAVKLVAAGAVAVTVALIAATKAIDFDTYKGYVADLVEAETGRKLTFGGPVKLRLGLVPSLIAENITLSNVAGGSRPEMITIERIEAEVALPALLRKEILIQRLILSSPHILLEKGNWRLADTGKPQVTGTPTRFNLRELKIKNAKVTWRDDGGRQTTIGVHKLALMPEQGNAGAVGVSVVGDAIGKNFEFTGKIGNLAAALAGKPWPVTLKGSAPGIIIAVDGAIGNLADFAGLDLKVSFQTDEMGDLLRLTGLQGAGNGSMGPMRLSARLGDGGGVIGISDLDASAGRRDVMFASVKGAVRDVVGLAGIEVSVQAETDDLARLGRVLGHDLPSMGPLRLGVTLRDGKDMWAASDLKLHAGSSDVTGDITLYSGKRPRLKADLAAPQLNVSDFLGKPTAAVDGGRVIPAAAVPVDLLRAYDAEIGLKLEKLVLSTVTLNAVTAEAILQNSTLTVPAFHAAFAGGAVEGGLTVEARPARPVVSLQMTATGVNFGKAAHDAGSDLLSGGIGDLKLALKGNGGDLRALMASANGSAVLNLGPGQVNNQAFSWAGGDVISHVLAILNPLAKSRETTQMSCAIVNFRVKNGLAATDKGIAVQTEGIDVVGAGTISLHDESLDLGFTPRAKEGLGLSVGGQFAGLTRLRGTLMSPSLSVDEMGTARAALSVGAAAATAGLSLLGELLMDKVMADDNPCRTALAMGKAAPTAKGGGGVLESLFGR